MEKEEYLAAFKDFKADDSAAPAPKKSADEPAAKKPEKEAPKKSESTSKAEQAAPAAKSGESKSDGPVFASPFARKLAEEKGIDLKVKILRSIEFYCNTN